MSTPSPTSPPKRPRLSLQIKAIANGPSGRTSRTLAAAVDVKSPTAFNTLSNVYATAVDRSTPVQDKPPATVLGTGRPTLRLQTQESGRAGGGTKGRDLSTPHTGAYLDTPLTAQPISPAVTAAAATGIRFPSAIVMTATPPLSAIEQNGAQLFDKTAVTPLASTFAASGAAQTPQSGKRRTTLPATLGKPPYNHPRSLRSILRNSPLPPLSTTRSPDSPRRQSVRLQEKAARRVAYNSPLCQTITTSKYTVSHIDLLAEDGTPTTPSAPDEDLLDQTMAYTGNETRDGGQTPGPFEEMRRRMAGLQASTPVTASSSVATSPTAGGGIRKRGARKKEKKRRWVWTIGQDDEEADTGSPVSGAAAASSSCPLLAPAPLPRKDVVSVPVIAMPAPRPRTRMQVARANAGASASGGSAVPVLAVPLPSRRTSAVAHNPAPTTPIDAPPGPACLVRTPELPAHAAASSVEPPTPSLSVGSSAADPVFESADVEMSDASSVWSETGEDTQQQKTNVGLGVDKVVMDHDVVVVDYCQEMDTDTPIATARPAGAAEEGRGWAPWIASG